MRKPQVQILLNHFKQNRPLTAMAAAKNYDITSFHRRLTDLKRMGCRFKSEWREELNQYGQLTRFKRYMLISGPRKQA